jgi:hypothetical protein
MDEGLEHLRALEGQVEYFNSLYQSNDKDANDIAELRASCMYEPPVVVRVVRVVVVVVRVVVRVGHVATNSSYMRLLAIQ